MTKKQITAVKKTITMWEWLRNNPTKTKYAYFIHKRINHKPQMNCYLCDEWIVGLGEGLCFGCPLGTKKLDCGNSKVSPYHQWYYGLDRDEYDETTKQSQRIINACKRWLKKYDN